MNFDFGGQRFERTAQNWYDTAQICRNGHPISTTLKTNPEQGQPFCKVCGEPTLIACPACSAEIRGHYHIAGLSYSETYSAPRFCHACGKPYPWTEARLDAARELANLQFQLSKTEREQLKADLGEVVRNTPRATVAATRLKLLIGKAGTEAPGLFKELLVGVVSNVVLKQMGLG